MTSKALVLFSGGQDSTTCLAWALERYEQVDTVGFDYGQRHRVELACRVDVLQGVRERFADWAGRLGQDTVLDVTALAQLGETALTASLQIELGERGLPNTFVPGRNLLFLTLAGALAYRSNAQALVTGVCETDFSGYPDCRDDTMKAMQVALNLGMETRLRIETPLMWLTKAETWKLADQLGGHALVDLIRTATHTCYLGDRTPHDWGAGCGACPACALRAKGYSEWAHHRL